MSTFTFVELFAGCGGTALGLENAGMECVLLNDFDPRACDTLSLNRPNWNVVTGDISNVDFSTISTNVDLLSANFPVQGFSVVGSRTELQGVEEYVPSHLTRAIKQISPKLVMLQSVPALLMLHRGERLKEIKKELSNLGYVLLEPKVLNTLDYEVPLKKKKLILIGVKQDLYHKGKFKWPKKGSRIMTLKDALLGGYMFNVDVPHSEGAEFSKTIQDMISEIPPGKRGRDLPIELQKKHNGRFNYLRRLSWFEPCPIPYHRYFSTCHPEKDRPLQIREVARVFTYPDHWDFVGSTSQIYNQLTNSFPSHLSYLLGKSIIDFLRKPVEKENDIGLTDRLFESRNVFNTMVPVYDFKPDTLDEYIYDGLRMLAKNKDSFIRDGRKVHNENKINQNLSGCLTRFEIDCVTEVDGNGRCDLLLSGKIGQEALSAIIECKKILETDSDIIFGKKLSSALEQIDSYGEIRSKHSKYIVLYIIDRSVDDIHKLFETLKRSDDRLTFSRVQSEGNSYSMYRFRDKKIVVRTLRTTAPSEMFEKSELTQQIHNALKYSDNHSRA